MKVWKLVAISFYFFQIYDGVNGVKGVTQEEEEVFVRLATENKLEWKELSEALDNPLYWSTYCVLTWNKRKKKNKEMICKYTLHLKGTADEMSVYCPLVNQYGKYTGDMLGCICEHKNHKLESVNTSITMNDWDHAFFVAQWFETHPNYIFILKKINEPNILSITKVIKNPGRKRKSLD